MSDIKKIDENYYGSKDEWLNIPGRLSDTYKAPSFGTLQNAYDSGKLVTNARLNNSFHMFGIKGDSDFLFPCSMIYDSISGYKLIRKKQDVTEIGYFSFSNFSYNTQVLLWKESNNNSHSNKMINGTGLKDVVTYPDLNGQLYPLVDFNYNFICALIRLHIVKQSEENKTVSATVYFDEFFDNKDTTYAGYKIMGYSFDILSGDNTEARQKKYPPIFGSINTNFPENELIKYPIFSYQPRYCLWGGGVFSNVSYTNPNNRDFEMCFFANPKYWTIEEFKNDIYYSYSPVFKGSKEDLLSLCSYIGIHFTGNSNSALYSKLGENITDENIYTPIIEEGILSGKYVRGKEGSKLPNAKWENNIRENTGYKGIDSIDPTNYSDKISLSNPKIKSEGKFNTLYALSESEINALSNELWGADENKLKQILNGLMLMGQNPLSCIVSLQLFPFDVTLKAQTTTVGRICLGATRMDTTGAKVKNLDSIIDLGSIKLRNYFNSFFDYEPYSTAFIYIPYCGTIQLSLNDCTGKTISIKLLVDYMNGVCTGVVFSDGIPILYKNGVISQQISVTGTDTATMASNAISSSIGLLTNTNNLLAGGKDTSSIINNSANLLSSSFDYSAYRTIYQTQGANTSQINMLQPQKAYLVINLPKFDIADLYGKYHGFRCDFYDTVKNLKGYVETDKPILDNITATEEEKQMITELMCGGFYV